MLTGNDAGAGVATNPAHRIVIVGAGFAGLGMAIRLRQAGITNFLLLERAAEVGGTWRDNTYPGCACDIPSHLYSFSFAPSADWSRHYAGQAEIQAYLLGCVLEYGLRDQLQTGADLQEAVYYEAQQEWRLTLTSGTALRAEVLILARGALSEPSIPEIPGLEKFAGPKFHSAHWDHSVDLTGKRVGVIGTGASAIQFVPQIAPLVEKLTLFQRTPAWILPKRDIALSPAWRRALRSVPLLRRAHRTYLYWSHEARAIPFVVWPWLMRFAERRARSYLKRQVVNPTLRECLIPDYRMGCKRILLSNDFQPSLNLPSVDLVTDNIIYVTSAGVKTAGVTTGGVTKGDGVERVLDVLILATGFAAGAPTGAPRVVGRAGADLRDHRQNYLGIAVPGFPNLFLLGGPNTGLGHNSIVFMLEAQIGLVLRRLRRHGTQTDEIRADAAARFGKGLDRRMRRTVWLSGCRSWYLDAAGRNTTLWPGFSIGYWLRTRLAPARIWRGGR